MRILFINFEYPPLGGGGGVATAQLAEELATRHTVHVITTRFGSLPKEEIIANVHIHRVRVLGRKELPTSSLLSLLTFVPSALVRGVTLIRAQKFDVVNAQFVIPSGLPAVILTKWFHIPFVVSFIGGDLYDPSKGISPHRYGIFRWVIRLISRAADAKTAISQDTKTRAIELHGVEGNISVIPIGLVPHHAAPASRAAHGVPDDVFLGISIGRLVARKGYETLLNVWRNIPHAHLIIIGDGPLKEKLQTSITTLNLANRVHLLGFVPEEEKQSLLRSSDIYVSAAQHEGFGIVFLEAMDAGLSIVAANDGGQKDFLEHGTNAFLVPPYDEEKIASAVQALQKDPQLRRRMGEQNLRDVQHYYLTHTARMFENILSAAVKNYGHSH